VKDRTFLCLHLATNSAWDIVPSLRFLSRTNTERVLSFLSSFRRLLLFKPFPSQQLAGSSKTPAASTLAFRLFIFSFAVKSFCTVLSREKTISLLFEMDAAISPLERAFNTFLMTMPPEQLGELLQYLQDTKAAGNNGLQLPDATPDTPANYALDNNHGAAVPVAATPRPVVSRAKRTQEGKKRPLNSFIAFRSESNFTTKYRYTELTENRFLLRRLSGHHPKGQVGHSSLLVAE
jgi:hypothetical protein